MILESSTVFEVALGAILARRRQCKTRERSKRSKRSERNERNERNKRNKRNKNTKTISR